MIVYYKLDSLLKSKGVKKVDLQKKINVSPSTMANFAKNKYVAMAVIDKICKELSCQPGDIMEYVDKTDLEKAQLESQIAELQAKLKTLQEGEE